MKACKQRELIGVLAADVEIGHFCVMSMGFVVSALGVAESINEILEQKGKSIAYCIEKTKGAERLRVINQICNESVEYVEMARCPF